MLVEQYMSIETALMPQWFKAAISDFVDMIYWFISRIKLTELCNTILQSQVLSSPCEISSTGNTLIRK